MPENPSSHELSEDMLADVVGGLPATLKVKGHKEDESCGKYYPVQGKEGKRPKCKNCIHATKNSKGKTYNCDLDW